MESLTCALKTQVNMTLEHYLTFNFF